MAAAAAGNRAPAAYRARSGVRPRGSGRPRAQGARGRGYEQAPRPGGPRRPSSPGARRPRGPASGLGAEASTMTPGCPAAPRGGRGAAPTCSRCGEAAVAWRGRTCGGGSSSRGEEGASFRKGWDLPGLPERRARRGLAPDLFWGPGCQATGRLPPPQPASPPPRGLRLHHPAGPAWLPGLEPSGAGGTASFALWTRSPLTQQKEGRNLGIPPPGGYLFLTCCNLSGRLPSVHTPRAFAQSS